MRLTLVYFRVLRFACLLILASLIAVSGLFSVNFSMVVATIGVLMLVGVRFRVRSYYYRNCPRCGYSLRGLRSRNCPECGFLWKRDRKFHGWAEQFQRNWIRNGVLLALAGLCSSLAAAALNYHGFPTLYSMVGLSTGNWPGFVDRGGPWIYVAIGTYGPPLLFLPFLIFAAMALAESAFRSRNRRAIRVCGLATAAAIVAMLVPACSCMAQFD